MSFTESDEEIITRRPIRKRPSRLDSMDITPSENTTKNLKLDPIVDTSHERTISTLSAGSSVDNSEGNRMEGGAAAGTNGRLPRKGRFLKGTTLMAEMKESRRSKQGKTPKKSLKSKNKEDKKTKSKKRKKDDKSSSLGLSLLDVPDVGICSLSEETTAVKKHSPSQHKAASKSKMKKVSRKRKPSSSSSPSDPSSSPSHLVKGKISFRGTKTDEDYSDILSPEIAIQTYEGKTDPPPLTNPPSQKDTSSVSSAVISPQINEEEPNIKILESWEKDVEPCSTIAPVLWALDHMKFTLEKKTDWMTKARTIWSKWKSLSKSTHRHYLEIAKRNRVMKECENSKVISETTAPNKVPPIPNQSSPIVMTNSEAFPSNSNRSSPDIIHVMSNPFAANSNDTLPPFPTLSVIGNQLEVNSDVPLEEFPGNTSSAMSALISPQSFYNKANNEDIIEAGLPVASSLPQDGRSSVDAMDNNMILASTMKALLANPYLFPSLLANSSLLAGNSGIPTQAQIDGLKNLLSSSTTPSFNNDDVIANHMTVTQPNLSSRDHVTSHADPLLLHLLPSTASDILSHSASIQQSLPIHNDLTTSSQLPAIITTNKGWHPSPSSATSNRGTPVSHVTSIPSPYFNGAHASSFRSAPVNNITNENNQVFTASVATKTSVPCPATCPSIDSELSSIQYRSNPYYTNTRSTITTEVTPSSVPSTGGATTAQPYVSPSILSPVSAPNVSTVTTTSQISQNDQTSSSVAPSLPSKEPSKHAQRRTKSTSTSPSPITIRKRVHSTGSTSSPQVALLTSSSNSISSLSSAESPTSSVSICTIAPSQKSISPSNIIIPRSCPPPSTTGNAEHDTGITDEYTIDSGTKLLEVSAEWKEALQKRMKEIFQKKKEGRSSPPKPSQPSHYLPRKQRRRKIVQDSTNKLTRPPMKVMPPSILQGDFNSPVSSPISPLETTWQQTSPPVLHQTELQPKAAPGTPPLIAEPSSHILAQHSPGPSPVMVPVTPLSSPYANNPLMDALNYAELERQYRHSLYVLETQQEHVEDLKKRLLQARMHQQMLFLQSEQYQRCARLLIKPPNEQDIPVSIPGYNPVMGDTSDAKQWNGTYDKPCIEGDNYYKTLMESIT